MNDIFWQEVEAHQKQKADREHFYDEIMHRIINDGVLNSWAEVIHLGQGVSGNFVAIHIRDPKIEGFTRFVTHKTLGAGIFVKTVQIGVQRIAEAGLNRDASMLTDDDISRIVQIGLFSRVKW